MTRQIQTVLAVLVFAALLGWHASYYYPFLSDDSLISLRYSQRLLEGHGLTWTDGPPVEGYSNLLWVLLVAAAGFLGADLVLAARVLGFLSIVVVLWCLRTYRGSEGSIATRHAPYIFAALFLVACAPIAVWSIAGLEQPLVAALLALGTVALFRTFDSEPGSNRSLLWASLAFGLLGLTRPDGPIFAVAAGLALFAARWKRGFHFAAASVTRLAIIPLTLYVGQLLFRLAYYDDYLPNTARVKISPSDKRFSEGWTYVQEGFLHLAPATYLTFAFIVALCIRRLPRARGLFLLAALTLWSGYLVFIGGDIFPAHRHFVPLIVIMAFAIREGVRVGGVTKEKQPSLSRSITESSVLLFVLLAIVLPVAINQFQQPANRLALEERWEWDGKKVALTLKQAYQESQPLVAVTAAGCIPFWSELPCLDLLGLNDHYLPRKPPEDFGEGFLGHELGDGEYMLRCEPDIVLFHTGTKPAFRAGNQLQTMPEAIERYAAATIQASGSDFEALLFLDRYSEKVGLRFAKDSIDIPALLFTELKATAALNADGIFEVPLSSEQPLLFHFQTQGDWEVDRVLGPGGDAIEWTLTRDGNKHLIELSTPSAKPAVFTTVLLKPVS